MQLGEPIGLLLVLTFSTLILGTNSGTDSIETISETVGSVIAGESNTDSVESITLVGGVALSAVAESDDLETMDSQSGSVANAGDSDSLESLL